LRPWLSAEMFGEREKCKDGMRGRDGIVGDT
jgi:hypothetical protein